MLQQRTAGPALVPYAPLGDQVVYPNMQADEAGRPLDGAKKYVLHFDAAPLAQFWTLTSYAGGTEIGRSDARHMTRNRDGSLTVFVQRARPGMRAANWLAVPKGSFTMTMRFYGPYRAVLDGVWRLPPVRRRET
ncbi:MAG TPA: DUF1214 domain-containing protein [Rhizomicrobium sp.]